MPTDPTPDPIATDPVVTALRAAGCVFAEDEARLLRAATTNPHELATLVARRTAGHPLEHVLGWAEFAGLRVAIDAGVFIPRHRTESLVITAAELAGRGSVEGGPERLVVVDLCCGSGALGLALVDRLGSARVTTDLIVELTAADVEPAAVACARRNLDRVGGHAYQGDLFDALPTDLRGTVDLLLANVPYVPTDEVDLLPPEARLYEPLASLDGGADGLEVLRRVAIDASSWLAPGGHLLSEVGESQAPTAMEILTAAGLTARTTYSDEYETTVLTGTRL
jgi:release factor glutamine methyltransferase